MIHITATQPSQKNWEHHLLIDLGKPCVCLSSAVLGGGFSESRYLINRSVSKDWQSDAPEVSMRDYATALQLDPSNCIGLMTAVAVKDMQMYELEQDGWVVKAFVSAGVANSARAGGINPLDNSNTLAYQVGTINIIVIVFASLSRAAMIGAVQTISEAKVAALQDACVQTRFKESATGTTTDACVLVNYLPEPESEYAGLATTVGFLIGQCVYRALLKALKQA